MSHRTNAFCRYKKYQHEVEEEVARTEQQYQRALEELRGVFREEGMRRAIRNHFVSRDSALDRLLTLIGIKRDNRQTPLKGNEPEYKKTSSLLQQLTLLAKQTYSKVQVILGEPTYRRVLWNFAKPIIITASLAFARTALRRGIFALFSLPLKRFHRSRQKRS